MSFNNPFSKPSTEQKEPSPEEAQEAINKGLRDELATLENEYGTEEVTEAIGWYFKGPSVDIVEHLTKEMKPASDALIKFLERASKTHGHERVQASLIAIGAERGIYNPETTRSITDES